MSIFAFCSSSILFYISDIHMLIILIIFLWFVSLIDFLCQDKWYFASYWSTILTSHTLYLLLIAKKSFKLSVLWIVFSIIKKQLFLLFL